MRPRRAVGPPAGKTGHRGVHRLRRSTKPASEVSTDLGCGSPASTGRRRGRRPSRAPTASACEPYRELIELAARPRPQRDGDLAGPRRRARLPRPVREREALRAQAARATAGRGAPGHRHGAGRGRPGRLRRRADGARIRTPASTAARGSSSSRSATAARCVRLLTFASSTRIWAELHEEAFRRLGGAVQRRRPRQSAARACSRPTSTTRRSIRSTATCSRTTASSRCPVACGDPDRKGKVESAIGHTQGAAQGPALRDARGRRRPTSIAGTRAGPTRASTARRSARSPRCLPRSGRTSGRCPLEPFRYYQYGTRTVHLDGCVEVDARLLPRAARLDRPRGRRSSGTARHVRLLDPAHRAAPARASPPGRRGRRAILPTIGRRARRRPR